MPGIDLGMQWAYPHPQPREVYSPGLTPADVAESETFWSEHAISADDREF